VEDWMTVKEAATRLGVTDSRVRQHIQSGRLPAAKVGPVNIIRNADVERLVRELTAEAGKKRGPVPNAVRLARLEHADE
jgi:excisionase family DNA binding protein